VGSARKLGNAAKNVLMTPSSLAHALLKKEFKTELTVFLVAGSVVGAKAGQKTPDGYYNVERMATVTARSQCVAEENGSRTHQGPARSPSRI
jgi:sulfur relay (sulfurtransferase) complex TusBCD TusD component (DsrE family)